MNRNLKVSSYIFVKNTLYSIDHLTMIWSASQSNPSDRPDPSIALHDYC